MILPTLKVSVMEVLLFSQHLTSSKKQKNNDMLFRPYLKKTCADVAKKILSRQLDLSRINGTRHLILQRGKLPLFVVPTHKMLQTFLQFRQRFKAKQVSAFILRRPPKTLNINVVQPTTTTVHTVLRRTTNEPTQKLRTRKLTPLITIENLRLARVRRQQRTA